MNRIKHVHSFFFLIFVISIFLLAFLFLNQNLCISVIGDEFGYYSAAAFFLDKPWQSLTASNSYYGWGYGIMLVPLLALSNVLSASSIYQLTILLNAVILVGIFFNAYECTKRVSKEKNKLLAVVIAGFIAFFPSNLYEIYNAMPELLLQLLYWNIFRVLLGLVDGKTDMRLGEKIWKSMVLIFWTILSFAVHQRTIGMLVIALICLLLFWITDDSKKNLIRTIFGLGIFMMLLLFVVFFIKSQYLKWIYENKGYIQTTTTNDFGSYISQMSLYFSLDALKGITISLMGKVFYSNISSMFLIGSGVIVTMKRILKRVKDKYLLIYLFSLFGWLQSIIIAAIAMPGGFESRTDILIYGRYIEYTFGPLIMFGLLGIFESTIDKSEVAAIIALQSFLTLIVKNNIASVSINTNMGNVFTIAKLFDLLSNVDAVCANSLVSILLFILIYFATRCFKYVKKPLLLLPYIMFEIIIFFMTYKTFILPWQDSVNDNVTLQKIYMEEKSNQDNLYLFESGIGGKMIQFLLLDEECIVVDGLTDINEGALTATAYSKENMTWIEANHDVIYQNKNLILWRK